MPKISFESVVLVHSLLRDSLVVEELVEAPQWSAWGPRPVCVDWSRVLGVYGDEGGNCEELIEPWNQARQVLLVWAIVVMQLVLARVPLLSLKLGYVLVVIAGDHAAVGGEIFKMLSHLEESCEEEPRALLVLPKRRGLQEVLRTAELLSVLSRRTIRPFYKR